MQNGILVDNKDEAWVHAIENFKNHHLRNLIGKNSEKLFLKNILLI